MMNKTYYVVTILILFGFNSCQDVLDVAPEGQHSLDEIFSDENTTGAYLNSCYDSMNKHGFEYSKGGSRSGPPITMADNCYFYDSWGNTQYDGFTNTWGISPVWSDSQFIGHTLWDLNNRNIRRCNIFLARMADPKTVVPDEQTRLQWTAEVKVLRVYYYEELIKNYGPLPIISEVKSASYDGADLDRSMSYHDCAQWIFKQIDEAVKEPNLPWRFNNSNDKSRMTKGIAYAIKSRVAVFMSSPLFNNGQNYWSEAETITKDCLNQLLSHNYELYKTVSDPALYGTNAYRELFCKKVDYSDNPTNKENIYESRTEIDTYNYMQWLYGTPINSDKRSGLNPTQELVDSYPMADGSYVLDLENPYSDEKHLQPNFNTTSSYDEQNPYVNRDPRFYATVRYNGSQTINSKKVMTDLWTFYSGNCGINPSDKKRTKTGYYDNKYRPEDLRRGKWTLKASFPIYRLAELYLNYAEAAIESNHLDDALILGLNPIRDRVYMPHITYTSQNDLRLKYRNERRIEMVYEERRYEDIRRWHNPGEEVSEFRWTTGMWIDYNGTVNGKGMPTKTPEINDFTYKRVICGDGWDYTNNTWTGTGRERMIYDSKYLLSPILQPEAIRLESVTGKKWQNPGWE
ncbi:RagB/SusD family nutrient uptake outer membrane protein [Flavobacterium ovatum]|nr:hypothetical protein [Flavobacterium sp. 7A]